MHIRLVMIVKNEAHVIRRCLDSARPLLSSWCIVDTGSTDGTQEIIREHLSDLPGVLHERAWVQETVNRNEALDLAREHFAPGYLFVIDADEVVEVLAVQPLPPEGPDAYAVKLRMGASHEFDRVSLVRSDVSTRYFGTGKIAGIHPTIMRADHTPLDAVRWYGFRVLPYPDGASWKEVGKYQRHADLLQQDADADPTNSRVCFYLAQSYRDASKFVEGVDRVVLRVRAQAEYRRRVAMGDAGFAEERWVAAWEAAQIDGLLGNNPTDALLAAHMLRPQRAECFWALAQWNNQRGNYALAYSYAAAAVKLDRVEGERLFVDRSVYRWRVWEELGYAAYYTDRRDEARIAFRRALAECALEDEPRMTRNLECC